MKAKAIPTFAVIFLLAVGVLAGKEYGEYRHKQAVSNMHVIGISAPDIDYYMSLPNYPEDVFDWETGEFSPDSSIFIRPDGRAAAVVIGGVKAKVIFYLGEERKKE